MKKTLCIAIACCTLFSACQKAPEGNKPRVITSTRSSSSSSGSTGENAAPGGESKLGAEDYWLKQMADDILNASFTVRATCPEISGDSSKIVQADEAFRETAAALLTENNFETGIRISQEELEKDARILTLRSENRDIYDNAVLYGYSDPESAPFPGQMVLDLETSDGASRRYLFDMAVFEEFDALMQENIQELTVSFSGNVVFLRSKFDLAKIKADTGFQTEEFLQFGTKLLWRFYPDSQEYTKPSTFELFDTASGQSLYSFTIQETVTRMEKYTAEPGFDYRFFTRTGVHYRSSANRSQEKVWRLPGTVSLFVASADVSGTFDVAHGKLAYAGEDGIYIAQEDGGNPQPVLFHSALSTIMQDTVGSTHTCYFNDPRFMLGGTRLVTSIVSPQTAPRRLGFAVTNLDTMETTYYPGITALDERSIRYADGKAVSAQDNGIINLINVENGDRGALPLTGLANSVFLTANYKNFIVWEPVPATQNKPASSTLFLCSSGNMSDRSQKLLTSQGDTFYPAAITEEYIIGFCEDSRGLIPTATRYRTAPRTAAPAPSTSSSTASGTDEEPSSSSGTSGSADETENGALPPDITPDL